MNRRFLAIGVRRGIRTGVRTASLQTQVAAIINSYGTQAQRAWLRADGYTVHESTGDVHTFVDRLDASHLLVQDDGARRVSLPAADAALNNALSVTFSADWYDSNRDPESWIVYHNGAGCTVVSVFVPTTFATAQAVLLASRPAGGGAGDIGFEMRRSSAATRVVVQNAASQVFSIQGGTMVDGTGYWSTYQYLTGRDPDDGTLTLNATQVAQGDANNAPSSGDPAGMRLGAFTGGGAPWLGRWAETMMIPGIISGDEMATIEAYIAGRYGLS